MFFNSVAIDGFVDIETLCEMHSFSASLIRGQMFSRNLCVTQYQSAEEIYIQKKLFCAEEVYIPKKIVLCSEYDTTRIIYMMAK